ncbi:MAG: fibronectin type III domain-containing protein, partial [Ilumatobacteraceae bacterium]
VQGASGSPHTFTGLGNGTSYQFQVRAHNSVGWGAYGALSAAVTPAGTPIGPPSISATSSAVGAVDLNWAAANANGSPVTAYQVSANGGAARNVGAVTSYRWGALANGTAYSFRVQACNDVGCGAWSAAASATTWGEPSQPSPPSLNPGDATLSATWTAPAANGNAISSYNIELDPGGVTANPDRSKAWSGLNNGTTYRVRVQACNAVGCGAWSGFASATPQSPISVRITKGAGAVGQPGCSSSSCAWVVLDASGLQANTTYTVTCHGDATGAFSASSTTTNGSGAISNNRPCYYGYPGTNFWVTVGSHQSNVISW